MQDDKVTESDFSNPGAILSVSHIPYLEDWLPAAIFQLDGRDNNMQHC